MDILIKLLATNKVANNFLGRSNKSDIIRAFLGFNEFSFSISCREREKKATSAPEIKAAKKSNIKMTIQPANKVKSRAEKNDILGGSKSKSLKIS